MRIRLTLVLCSLVTLAPAALAQRGKKQEAGLALLANGGFEEGLEGWRTLNMSGSTRFELDEKDHAEGKRSLRIERSAREGASDFLKRSVDLPSARGDVWISLAYRVEKGSRLEAAVYFFDADSNTLGRGQIPLLSSGKTRGFETVEKELEVPEGAHGFGLNVVLAQPGTVWIDDVRIEARGDHLRILGPLELANPGFDTNVDFWREVTFGSGTTTAAHDAKAKAGGKGALRLERESARLFPEDGVTARAPTGGKARRATLAFDVRVEEGARAVVVLQAMGAGDVALATERVEIGATDDRFASEKLTLQLPKGSEHVDVLLLIGGAGRVWYDELELKK